MSEERKIEMLDILVILVRKKFLILLVAILTAAAGYISVYFLIDEKFESTAVVVPYESGKSGGGMSSLLKSIGSLPIGGLSSLGGGSSDLDFYLTIVYSRTTLTEIIDKFGLRAEYDQKYFADLLKMVIEDIRVVNNDDLSVSVSVRNKNPKKAAEMANYIVDVLNRKILEINTRKSRDNRMFLEKRYTEVTADLRESENNLEAFQKKNGVFEAEQQVKSSVTAYTELEMELARKQVEFETAEKMLGANTPSVKSLKDGLIALEKKVNDIKAGKGGSSVLIPMGSLPTKAIQYFRLYRDVKINSEMLEFLLPLYEQAKFDEQKETPIILTIDKAIPSDKKVYPPRTVFALLISVFSAGFVSVVIVLKEVAGNVGDPKIRFLMRNFFAIRRKED